MARITGESVDLDMRTPVAPRLPKLPPNSPFLLMHHPSRWDVIEGKVRPMLVRLPITPGLNEVTSKGDYGPAILKAESEGYVVLTSAMVGESYLARFEVQGGWHYELKWAEFDPGEDTADVDMAAYCEFLDSLVERGIIAEPTPSVLRRLAKQYRDKSNRARGQGTPQAGERADVYDVRIKIIDAVLQSAEAKRRAEREARKAAPEAGDAAPAAKKPRARRARKEAADVE